MESYQYQQTTENFKSGSDEAMLKGCISIKLSYKDLSKPDFNVLYERVSKRLESSGLSLLINGIPIPVTYSYFLFDFGKILDEARKRIKSVKKSDRKDISGVYNLENLIKRYQEDLQSGRFDIIEDTYKEAA